MSEDENADPREEGRSNVFLSAVLTAGSAVIPVRVRNLSANGALLSGEELPADGRVVLRRGDLRADGEVAWQTVSECGVRFDNAINVASWVKRLPHQGQQRVDTIVAALRAGVLPHTPGDANPTLSLKELSDQLTTITSHITMLPNMTTELAEQILKLEALAKILADNAAPESTTTTISSIR